MGKFSSLLKDKIKYNHGKKRMRVDDLPMPEGETVEEIVAMLVEKLKAGDFSGKSAKIEGILELIGAGAFSENNKSKIPKVLLPFIADIKEQKISKRFRIPYLNRILSRLVNQKLITIGKKDGFEIASLNHSGQRRILKYALNLLSIDPQKKWDCIWRIVSYDLSSELRYLRNILRSYLVKWGFVPIQESLFVHAYPCELEVDVLSEYLGISDFVRLFEATKIQNDKELKKAFKIE